MKIVGKEEFKSFKWMNNEVISHIEFEKELKRLSK